MRRMEIELRLSGAASSAQAFAAAASGARDLSRAYHTLSRAQAKLAGTPQLSQPSYASFVTASPTAASPTATLARGQVHPRARSATGRVSGPYQSLVKAQEAFHEAMMRGTPAEVRDAQVAIENAKRRLDKLSAGPAPSSLLTGPFARLEAARKNYQEALTRGTASQVMDAKAALDRAARRAGQVQRHLEGAGRQPFVDKLFNAAFSTRIGFSSRGIEIAPLVGRMVQLVAGSFKPSEFLRARAAGIGGGARMGAVGAPAASGAASGGTAGAGAQFATAAASAGQAATALGVVSQAGAGASAGLAEAGTAGGFLAALLSDPVAIALAAFVVAVGSSVVATLSMVEAAKRAAAQFAAFGAARMMSGGTAADTARLSAMGVAPGEQAGAASSFRQGIATDPFMQAAAARLGIGVQIDRKYGGGTNEAALLQRALDRLYQIGQSQGATAQLVAARQLNLEQFLPRLNVSREERAAQGRQAGVSGSILGNQQFQRDANDFNSALARIPENFQLAIAAFGGPAMAPIAGGLRDLGAAIGDFAAFIRDNPGVPRFLGELAGAVVHFGAFLARVATFAGRASAALNPVVQALNALAGAGNDIGSAFRKLKDGFIEWLHVIYQAVQQMVEKGSKGQVKLPDWGRDKPNPTPALAPNALGTPGDNGMSVPTFNSRLPGNTSAGGSGFIVPPDANPTTTLAKGGKGGKGGADWGNEAINAGLNIIFPGAGLARRWSQMHAPKDGDKQDADKSATERLIDALNRLAAATDQNTKYLQPGTYGPSRRASGIAPMSGEALRRAIEANIIRQGEVGF